ncbi:LPS export ABC transporter permease LptG [Erythrobacter sp. LQ02-29]|uniref:LPS export ABC transporter permease LptG n=1 Tax=unclassified Erythrobacter TaxID=2633097 RepID=UPI001BFC793F|nr:MULTISPECIES: LPS export ABC transporter permease LptG [unclassified Erythrobacter]MCP9221607.1 LPS export ABC transporter permease LptG [Erythrobacter sp. LQ02-29]QWC57127.1 LPS export ABC transporter permease LptG [Erythrobacter sp. 3-20A1M]
MQLDFFPSRRLTLYLGKMFVTRIIAMLAVLVLVLMMLDLLSTSGDILAVKGNGQGQLLYYVSLRIPQLVQTFLPYSVLLATIITLVGLNQNSEVIAMKAAGLSAHQVLAPLFLTALIVSALTFVFNERVVTRATAALNAWQAVEYGPIPRTSDTRSNVYVSDGENILMAKTVSGAGAAMRLSGVTWYARNPGGEINDQLRARLAQPTQDGWRLVDAQNFDVATAATTTAPAQTIRTSITPAEIALESVKAETQSLWELSDSIAAYEAAGRSTAELRMNWWHKISGPLAALLMPLLGAIAAFGLARSGQLFLRAVIAMAMGFAFFLIDNAALALGNFGGYPPFLAAWAPFLLFFLIGETVLIRTEE